MNNSSSIGSSGSNLIEGKMENVLNKQFCKLKEAMDEILELKQTVCIV